MAPTPSEVVQPAGVAGDVYRMIHERTASLRRSSSGVAVSTEVRRGGRGGHGSRRGGGGVEGRGGLMGGRRGGEVAVSTEVRRGGRGGHGSRGGGGWRDGVG